MTLHPKNVTVIPFSNTQIGREPKHYVTLFNPNFVAEEVITGAIRNQTIHFVPCAITVTQEQYESVFGPVPDSPINKNHTSNDLLSRETDDIAGFLKQLDHKITPYMYQMEHQNKWYDVVRLNKSKKTVTLALDERTDMTISMQHITRIKPYDQ